MKREMIYSRLNDVFRDVFDDINIVVSESTTSKDIENWDSLEHINLIVAVEQEFGIKFNMSEVINMSNVGDMVAIILSKIKE